MARCDGNEVHGGLVNPCNITLHSGDHRSEIELRPERKGRQEVSERVEHLSAGVRKSLYLQ